MQYSTSSEGYVSSKKDTTDRKNKGDKGYMYKKSTYQYSSGNNMEYSNNQQSSDQNIDQLDALLEDLKNERQITREKDILLPSSTYRTMERERLEPAGGTVTKTTKVYKTITNSGDREKFGSNAISDYNTIKLNEFSKLDEMGREAQTSYVQKKPIPDKYETQSRIYESKVIENSEVVPTNGISSISHIEKDLQNIALTEDILPVPGTKVTTTVRTYTYEVPPTTNTIFNRNKQSNNTISYNSVLRDEINDMIHTYPVPQTVTYNTESYSTINKNNVIPKSYEITERREINTNNSISPHTAPPTTGTSKTVVYNVNKTENIHSGPSSNSIVPRHPPNQQNGLPPQPTTSRYYFKESSNIVNTYHGKPLPRDLNPPHTQNQPYTHSPPNASPNKPHPVDHPNNTITYNYTSSTTDTRHEHDLGIPPPFPVDIDDNRFLNAGPPQRVDELMQSFGNTDSVDKSVIETPHRKREVETAVASPNQTQFVPSINKVGKEVYYPPGHGMMMTKHEEMASGSAAGGRWAKGSGMYEYESGYKSKSKTKSGGAMVPVCLPLCCAMPCSIM